MLGTKNIYNVSFKDKLWRTLNNLVLALMGLLLISIISRYQMMNLAIIKMRFMFPIMEFLLETFVLLDFQRLDKKLPNLFDADKNAEQEATDDLKLLKLQYPRIVEFLYLFMRFVSEALIVTIACVVIK